MNESPHPEPEGGQTLDRRDVGAVQEVATAASVAAEAATEAACAAAETSARAAEAAKGAARYAALVARVGVAVAREVELDRMIAAVLHQARETLGARCAYVHLADEAGRELRLAGRENLPSDLVAPLARLSYDSPSLASRAAQNRCLEVLRWGDRREDLGLPREILRRMDSGILIAAPLISLGRFIGVLSYALPAGRDLLPEEQVIIQTAASIFAVGVANALTFDSERRLRKQIEATSRSALAIARPSDLMSILQAIVDQARVVVDAEYAALGVSPMPGGSLQPWVFSGMPPGTAERISRSPRPIGLLGEVALAGGSLRVADLRKHPAYVGLPDGHPEMTTFLGVPIAFEGRVIGHLFLANKHERAQFTAEDERMIELLAAHAGAAIEHAHLRDSIATERARFAVILERAPHAIVFVDAVTGLFDANAAACALTGQELQGRRFEDLRGTVCRTDGTVLPLSERLILKAQRGQATPPTELILVRPDGTRCPVLATAAPILTNGSVQGVVLVAQDISSLKELERLREEFAALIAHDLRSPLSTILLSLEQMLADVQGERVQVPVSSLCRVKRAAQHLTGMVTDLLDASRIEVGRLSLRPEPVAVGRAVAAFLDQIRPTLGLHPVELSVESEPELVRLDPGRLDQVLSNLLDNAARYSDLDAPIAVRIQTSDGGVVISIEDRGPGIAPEELPHLFDRFYQAQRARQMKVGLGLGLYIAKGLVEAHGGRIWVESLRGQGSTFHVWFPGGQPEPVEAPSSWRPEPLPP